MPRITPAERERFHKILDDSIDKMDNPKNAGKEHWSLLDIEHLTLRQNDECNELKAEVFGNIPEPEKIESECYDNINFPMFIIDNLRENR